MFKPFPPGVLPSAIPSIKCAKFLAMMEAKCYRLSRRHISHERLRRKCPRNTKHLHFLPPTVYGVRVRCVRLQSTVYQIQIHEAHFVSITNRNTQAYCIHVLMGNSSSRPPPSRPTPQPLPQPHWMAAGTLFRCIFNCASLAQRRAWMDHVS